MKTEVPEQEQSLNYREKARSRIRLARQILRPLPRRATLHKWPVLKWFAKAARKQPHLWKFGHREVSLAIYLGSIIAFLPIMGFQFVIAFFVALAVRANLLVIMGVQLVTNVFTFLFIYRFTGQVGGWLVDLWHLPSIHAGFIVNGTYHLTIGGLVVGLLFGFIVDMLFRFVLMRRANKPVNVKRMLKS